MRIHVIGEIRARDAVDPRAIAVALRDDAVAVPAVVLKRFLGGRFALGEPFAASSLVVDVVSLVGPRLGLTLTLANAGQPVPEDLERQLVAVELARLTR